MKSNNSAINILPEETLDINLKALDIYDKTAEILTRTRQAMGKTISYKSVQSTTSIGKINVNAIASTTKF